MADTRSESGSTSTSEQPLHRDPYTLNTYRPEDPRYFEQEVAMQRESRAATARRHPAGTKLRVADFWRLYYQHQASAEKHDPDSIDAQTARRSSRARSGSYTDARSPSRSINPDQQQLQLQQQQQPTSSRKHHNKKTEKEQQELEEAGKSLDLNAKVPAGGNATCIGIVDGGLTILVGRDNGRVAVVDGLNGELVQDIDVALAARPRNNPRRREVATSLKYQRGEKVEKFKECDENEKSTSENNNNNNKDRSLINEEPKKESTPTEKTSDAVSGENNKNTKDDTASSEQKQQPEEASPQPLCPADSQEKAMEKRDQEGERTEPEVVSCITVFTPRALGRPMFLVGAASGRIFLFDATTLSFLTKVDLEIPNKIAEMRWLSEGQVGEDVTEIIGRNDNGDLFVLTVETSETPQEDDIRNIAATMKVSKRRDAVPSKQKNQRGGAEPLARIVSMVALGGTVWVGDSSGLVHTLDPEDLGRVLFASDDLSLYTVTSDSQNPAVTAVAVGGSFTYVAVENNIHVLALSGMPKDRTPLSSLTAHKAQVISLDFDHATGRLWSRDAAGVVACYDGTSKSGFALRTTMQMPVGGGPICDIKFCSYETHVRLWTMASNGLNKQWCAGFAAGSTDATNQAALNEADMEVDAARSRYWTEAVNIQSQVVDRRRIQGAICAEEFNRTRTLSDAFDVWKRFRRQKQFLRIQPLHARMLTTQADLSLTGRSFRRWLQFRLEKRVVKIQQGGARLLLKRIDEETQSAFFRRWLRFRTLRCEKKSQAVTASVFNDATGRITAGHYFNRWSALAVRQQMQKRKREMAEIVFHRWQKLKMQTAFDTWSRLVAQLRAKRLANSAVQILGNRLNRDRLRSAFRCWGRIRESKQIRARQQKLSDALDTEADNRRTREFFHSWIQAAAAKRETRHSHDNKTLTEKVAGREEEYMANKAHVDRVKLLKSLRATVAQLKKETDETKQKIAEAEKKSETLTQESKAAREKNEDPKIKGTVRSVTQRLSREMLNSPSEDAKLVSAVAKESSSSNAKAIQASTTQVRTIIEQNQDGKNKQQQSSSAAENSMNESDRQTSTASTATTIPHLVVEIDAFGERIGRTSAEQLVEHVRRISLAGLATSDDLVKESVDEANSNFLLQHGDNLGLCAKRLQDKPPAIPVVVSSSSAGARGARKSSPKKGGTGTKKTTSSSPKEKKAATGDKKAASPAKKPASASAKPPARSSSSAKKTVAAPASATAAKKTSTSPTKKPATTTRPVLKK